MARPGFGTWAAELGTGCDDPCPVIDSPCPHRGDGGERERSVHLGYASHASGAVLVPGMPDVLQELLICDAVFRPGHQVSSCLGVSAVREFVSLPLAVCGVPGCPGQCLYEVGQDLAIRAHDAAGRRLLSLSS
jgi:hypothetical protein